MATDLNTEEELSLYVKQKYAERALIHQRPSCRWQLPLRSTLSLSQCHKFLRDRLAEPRSERDNDLRARLLAYFSTWKSEDDAAIFVIAKHLDELLFGEIIGKHAAYVRLPIDGALGFSQMWCAHEGFNHLVVVALDINFRANATKNGVKPRITAAELWGTLIHEMLHAYTMIATGEERFLEEVCKCRTMVHHGSMWAETIGRLATRLDIGIAAEDMTNRLEICHEPDHDVPLDISKYQGVLRTDKRRYSAGQSTIAVPNYTHKRSVQTPHADGQTKEEAPKVEKTRQRSDTWPPRRRRMPNGTSRLSYDG